MKQERWNDDWKFWEDHDAFALIWDVPKDAESISLPHDAMLRDKAYLGSKNGVNTGYRDGDCYIYRKELYVSDDEKNTLHVLKFEGVYMNAFVYVNGQLCVKSPFGYSTFYAELDSFLKYGENNEIRVLVRAGAMTNSRWYSGAGIYRDVYLLTSQKTHLVPEGVQIHTESVDEDYVVVVVETELDNRNSNRVSLVIRNVIVDEDGNHVGSEQSILSLSAGEKRILRQRINVSDVHLWDDNHPYLYTCKTSLCEGNFIENHEIDCNEELFGIRVLQLDSIRGLRVNGKEVLLRGACIHHDSGILGAATYDEAQYRQIKLLKEAGFNAIRMAHNPAALALLRACDELGMYVMDEYTDIWNRMKSFYDYGLYFEEWWEKDITSMVRKNYNHPSVILYSIGNEIPEIGTDQGAEVCHRLNEKIKELDSTRYTLASMNGVFAAGDSVQEILEDFKDDIETPAEIGNVNTFMALMGKQMDKIVVHPAVTRKLDMACPQTDIAGYNYMTARYRVDHETYPNRVIVGSETYPASIARNWKEVKELPYVIGDFTWTGWDYLGEAGGGIPQYAGNPSIFDENHIPQTAYYADLDLIGARQPSSYYRNIVFGLYDKPYIAVQNPAHYGEELIKSPWMLTDAESCWNWDGYENKSIRIEVYSNAEKVVLYFNDELIGEKNVGEITANMAVFETVYQPGILKAVNYIGEEAVSEAILQTASCDRELSLVKEELSSKHSLNNNIIFVKISSVDTQMNVAADDTSEITIETDGCTLLGFGSGNPMPCHNFLETTTNLHHGHALAVLKKTEETGIVRVRRDDGSVCEINI